ncbi:MAG: sn-glycerol-3-phosphate ABC transporter ATP-binding protein UgpC [Oscillospiraceae bacterium]|jgi:multiple sugar transport system ATP-binding protein|nr:sn-glycerol-3-phosphate ABC transporter ATP-binding protein UgpC [Oscillospiraceae bacterium]
MASVSLKHIYKRYAGSDLVAVTDFSMDIKDKEFIILVGPSGCGKSTTLRMIAGLEEISDGDLFIGDRRVNDVSAKDRDIAMVFQNYALYPHMSVFDNMAFGLKLRHVPKDEIKKLVEEAAKILDIGHLLDRRPKALSGGQRQRVALGRCIVRDPQVFLLDEPLSNLDAKLRAQMRTELSKLHKKLGTTFIYVTHDQIEAMTMGDRIVIMKDGFVQQVDSPVNLYSKPCNKFVAGFIGSPQMNFLDAKLIKNDGKYTVEFGSDESSKLGKWRKFYIEVPVGKGDPSVLEGYVGREVSLGIRPENISDDISNARTGLIEATVDIAEMIGAETYLYLTCQNITLTVRVSNKSTARAGDTIKLAIDPNFIHLFDKQDEHALFVKQEK